MQALRSGLAFFAECSVLILKAAREEDAPSAGAKRAAREEGGISVEQARSA